MNGYKVVNYDWNQSLPQVFSTFQDAFDAQQKWDKNASIDFFDGDSVETVWTREYEDVVTVEGYLLNRYETDYLAVVR